jgi:iron only hydrogenase large subunit-like protein
MCLGCMTACPVQAITLGQGEMNIQESRCVDCGLCHRACGHGAVEVPSQVSQVQTFIRAKRKVILSLDPACRTQLPKDATVEQLAAAVQKLGIWDVADASEAVAAVASEYARVFREKPMDNLIFSSCPVVRNLVEQHFPGLMGALLPVASPMIAHGRMLKKDFTSAAVVYVTTCGARAREALDVRHSTEINAVLTMAQLMEWLQQEDIVLSPEDEEPLLSETGGLGLLGAVPGGMLQCFGKFAPNHSYRTITASGMEQCMALLTQMEKGNIHHCVLDLMACPDGCVGGPDSTLCSADRALGRLHLEDLAAQEEMPYFDIQGIAMANPAIARPCQEHTRTEEEVQEMLFHIGVGNPRQQQNCGACGYATCRLRAEAILDHKEPVSLCRRVVYEARRDVFRVLYEKLPMAALLVDETQQVVGMNQDARSLFSLQPEAEKYIFELMDPVDFQYVLETGLPIKNRRMDIPEIYMRVEANLVPLKELHMVLGLFRDITEEEEADASQQRSRLQSVEMAQKVIEKQMTVAQQIAFLLGETTAETKVTLNQLKQRILGEEEQP